MKISEFCKLNKKLKDDILLLLLLYITMRAIFFIICGDWSWEHDSYEHFYQSRLLTANWNWEIVFNTWNKCIFTILSSFLIKIWDSLWIIRFFNALLWFIITIIVYQLVGIITKKRSCSLAAACFCMFDYISFRASVGELSEPIGTLFIVLGIAINRAFFGFIPLTRPEAILIAFPFFIEKPSKRLLKDIFLASLPNFLALALSYFYLNDSWYPFRSHYPIHTEGIYGTSTWYYYVKLLAFYNPVSLLVLTFVTPIIISKNFFSRDRHSTLMFRCLMAFILYFFFQSYLYVNDLMGSAGLCRYLTVVMPILSIFFGYGLYYLSSYFKKNQIFACASILVVLVSLWTTKILFNKQWHFNSTCFPPKYMQLKKFSQKSADIIAKDLDNRFFVAADPAMRYFAKLPPSNTKWPKKSQFNDKSFYIAIEPHLKTYSGIDLDFARKQGDIILEVGPFSLLNSAGKSLK